MFLLPTISFTHISDLTFKSHLEPKCFDQKWRHRFVPNLTNLMLWVHLIAEFTIFPVQEESFSGYEDVGRRLRVLRRRVLAPLQRLRRHLTVKSIQTSDRVYPDTRTFLFRNFFKFPKVVNKKKHPYDFYCQEVIYI